ncbi:MAG: hypothetical protein Kow0047_23150 [Anaerolineae bacterium]
MTRVIIDTCIRDGLCADVCPEEAIVPGQPEDQWPTYYIDPDACLDCGVCESECPTNSIFAEEDLPEDKVQFAEINARFFSEGPGYAARDM